MRSSTSGNSQKAFLPSDRPLFYYITGQGQLAGRSLHACIRRTLAWGIDFIQIREKNLGDRALFELTREAVALARGTDCRILVNGRADIALAAGAHGAHLPSDNLRISDIRPWLPKHFIVGISVHSMSEIRRACDDKADYILLGHLFPTPSKSSYGKPLGMDYLRKVCAKAAVPVFGLGGIGAERIRPVLDAGAAGVAGISLFQKMDEFRKLKGLYPSRL
jgi:thiamine-phosphate pyrophosphorylase